MQATFSYAVFLGIQRQELHILGGTKMNVKEVDENE
jgi:hypothetical protein